MRTADIILLILAGAVLCFAGWLIWRTATAPEGRPVGPEDAINVLAEPLQEEARWEALPTFEIGGKRIFLASVARYRIDGILVAKKRHRLGWAGRLAPWDHAIAWGNIRHMLPHVKFRQSGRYCSFRYAAGAPVNGQYVQNHTSNNHLIPANKNILRALSRAKKGREIGLEGYLVDVTATQNGSVAGTWNTSRTRADGGNGACELIYVTRLRLDDTVYE
ncbi:MAG: hypothetical protein ACP5F3_03090 [Candidatus Syntrophosphaera sp.]